MVLYTKIFFFHSFFFLLFCTNFFFYFRGENLKKFLRSLVSFFFRNDEKLFSNLYFFPFVIIIFWLVPKTRIYFIRRSHSLHIFSFYTFSIFFTSKSLFPFLVKLVIFCLIFSTRHFWLLTFNDFFFSLLHLLRDFSWYQKEKYILCYFYPVIFFIEEIFLHGAMRRYFYIIKNYCAPIPFTRYFQMYHYSESDWFSRWKFHLNSKSGAGIKIIFI